MKEFGSVVREILDNIGDGILFIDRDYEIVFANRALFQICGQEEQEVIGQKCYGLLHQSPMPCQKKDPSVVCSRDEVFRTGRAVSVIHTYKMQDGIEKVFDITASPIMNEKGEVIQVLEILRDVTEKRKTEEKIILANERLKFLLSSTSAVVYTAKASGDYGATFITDNVVKMIGYEKRKFLEKSSFWIDNVHPEDKQRILTELPIIFENGYHSYEYRFRNKEGKYIWVRDEMRLVRDKKSNPLEILGFWLDITKHKQAEEALCESEGKYRALFEQAPDAILLIEAATGALVEFNDKAFKNLGYTRKKFSKLKISDFEVIESAEEVEEHIKKIVKEGTHIFETKHRRKDGQIRDVLVSARDVSIGGKDFIQSIWCDITERKKAEESLRESEERFRRLSEASLEGIAITEKGKLLDVSKRFAEMFGYKHSEMIGMHVSKLVAPEYHDFVMQKILSEYEKPFEAVGVKKDGTLFPTAASGKTIHYKGRVARVTTLRDITERKQAEESLRESEKKYRNFVDNALVGIYKTNVKGNILYANNALTNMLEFESPEEMIRQGVLTRYKNVKDRDVLIESLKEKGRVTNFNIEVLTKTGRTISVLLNAALDGDTISGMIMDVTEQRRAEKVVRESEAFFSSIFEGIQDGVVVLDRDFRILFANSSYVERVGSLSNDIKGKHCYGVLYNRKEPCYSAGVKCSVKKVFETGLRSTEIRKKGGNHIEIIVYPLKDSSGKVISVVEIRRDVTSNMQLNEEVKKRVRELEEFYDMAVGRELKMIELKEEVERLKKALRKYKT